ncbi:MAG: BON domain-containing protein [Pseudomonadota bacterium]
MIKLPAAAAVGLLALSCTGCVAAAVGTAGAVGVAAVQERSAGQAVDDAVTSNDVKTRLLREDGMLEVDVEVVDGLVLLSGRVASPDRRTLAENVAWSSVNTRDVANEITIERPGGFFANVNDELITARVRRALIASQSVRSFNFNIETYDGVVYLMGIATSQEELVAAAEEASYVGGVQQVVSYVQVREVAPAAQSAGSNAAAQGELRGGSF